LSFYKVYKPSPALSVLIREYQVFHIQFDKEENAPPDFITCLANTEQNLYFIVHDPMKIVPVANVEIPAPPVIVTGPRYKPNGLLFGKDHLMIKVCFHPTGTYRLLGMQMKQTVNTGLDASLFWGEDVKEILNQLRRTASYDEMIQVVSSFIEKRFDLNCRKEEPIDDIAIRMLDPLENCSLEQWAAKGCLSLRQFERNFINRIGISPKLFVRIVRFGYAMKIKNSFPGKSWSQVATECNYTDSAHLLKEFKKFAEFPPSKFYLQPTSGYSELPTG
jgi:AraC-like DNA-binding protein